MATTKKTVKTDNKKTTSKKTTPKKTATKKKKEETGVVDEFLNENIGGVITTPEVDENEIKEEFAKQSEDGVLSLEKTPEETIDEMESELSEILDKQITEENIGATEESLKKYEQLKEKWNELGLTDDMQEDIKEVVSNLNNNEKETVDDLRVNLEVKTETRPFTYVNNFMGVKYD